MAQVLLSNISGEDVQWAIYTNDNNDQGGSLKPDQGTAEPLDPDVTYVGFTSFNGSVLMTGPATSTQYAAELIAFDSGTSADDVQKALARLHAKLKY